MVHAGGGREKAGRKRPRSSHCSQRQQRTAESSAPNSESKKQEQPILFFLTEKILKTPPTFPGLEPILAQTQDWQWPKGTTENSRDEQARRAARPVGARDVPEDSGLSPTLAHHLQGSSKGDLPMCVGILGTCHGPCGSRDPGPQSWLLCQCHLSETSRVM